MDVSLNPDLATFSPEDTGNYLHLTGSQFLNFLMISAMYAKKRTICFSNIRRYKTNISKYVIWI